VSEDKLVFLSGRIDGVDKTVSAGWRDQAELCFRDSNYQTYNPSSYFSEFAKSSPNEIFTRDTYYLRRADVLLVNLDLPETIVSQDAPFFTIGEMFLAHASGMPIVTFGQCFRGRPGYEAIVTKSMENLEQCTSYIKENY
jgi:hypothetical protein